MSEYNEGDLVEAVKGDTVIRGRLDHRAELTLTTALTSDMRHLKATGYVVTVIERATPPLPSEAGIYVDRDGDTWLHTNTGGWSFLTDGYHRVRIVDIDAAENAPFTRLEPAPVTAKRISDWLWEHRNDIKGTDSDEWRALCYDLEKTFGVTEP